jgi:hypothetical protein
MFSRSASYFLILMLCGCAGQGGLRGGAHIPDPDSPAAQIYIVRCGTCHAVPHPARHSYPDWQYLVALMEQRMVERGFSPLTSGERTDILAYLQLHAR